MTTKIYACFSTEIRQTLSVFDGIYGRTSLFLFRTNEVVFRIVIMTTGFPDGSMGKTCREHLLNYIHFTSLQTTLRGVGSNQIMGGQTLNRKIYDWRLYIFCTFGPTIYGWAIAPPSQLAPTPLELHCKHHHSRLVKWLSNFHSYSHSHHRMMNEVTMRLSNRGHSITTWTRWGGMGSKNVCFCPRSGYKNCPHRGGVKKWQNSVHVVVECPLNP